MNYTEFLQKEKAYMEAYEEIRETAVSICKHFTELNPQKYPLLMGSDQVNVITTSADVKIKVKNLFDERIREHIVPTSLFFAESINALTEENCTSISYIAQENDIKPDEMLCTKVRIFNEKYEDAKIARAAITEYLSDIYDFGDADAYDCTVDESEWCYGIRLDKLDHFKRK